MNPDVKKKWVTRLQRTKKKQGVGGLGTPDGYRCCLGILCDLAVEAKVIPPPTVVESIGRLQYAEQKGVLPREVTKWAGLHKDNPDVTAIDRYEETRRTSLATLNDGTQGWKQHSFKEIAQIIKEQL